MAENSRNNDHYKKQHNSSGWQPAQRNKQNNAHGGQYPKNSNRKPQRGANYEKREYEKRETGFESTRPRQWDRAAQKQNAGGKQKQWKRWGSRGNETNPKWKNDRRQGVQGTNQQDTQRPSQKHWAKDLVEKHDGAPRYQGRNLPPQRTHRGGERFGENSRELRDKRSELLNEIPDSITAESLDAAARGHLRNLNRENADIVARHLAYAGEMLDIDPEVAYRHAKAAFERAARIDIVREALGITAYVTGRYQEALSELRTYRRMSNDFTHVPMEADAERGMGRSEKALRFIAEIPLKRLNPEAKIELALVTSGARADVGDSQGGLAVVEKIIVANLPAELAARVELVRAQRLSELGREAEAQTLRAKWEAAYAKDAENDAVVLDLAEVFADEPADIEEQSNTNLANAKPANAGNDRGAAPADPAAFMDKATATDSQDAAAEYVQAFDELFEVSQADAALLAELEAEETVPVETETVPVESVPVESVPVESVPAEPSQQTEANLQVAPRQIAAEIPAEIDWAAEFANAAQDKNAAPKENAAPDSVVGE